MTGRVENGSEKLHTFYDPLIWERMADHVVILNCIQEKNLSEHCLADSQKTEDGTKSTGRTDIAGQTEYFSYHNTNFAQMFQSKGFTQSPAALFIPLSIVY